jgi:hypothetical protein
MRLLDGFRGKTDIAELIKLPMKAGLILGPQCFEYLQHFIRSAATFLKGDAERGKLLAPPTDPNAADETTIREGVDGREHLGHHHWVAMPEDKDGGAKAGSDRTHRSCR